jgi:hypothetical protein
VVRIKEPKIKKFPTEYFGYPYAVKNKKVQKERKNQYCHFLGRTCNKPRKSEPHVKIGVCSVGYKGEHMKEHAPIIICPHRFYLDSVFQKIIEEHFSKVSNDFVIQWVPEVSIGVGGSIDFVAAKRKKVGSIYGDIEEFVCVEFQAGGTTGTPWEAVKDFKRKGRFLRDSYEFGINWANEFAKTMMQQVYKKGKIIESWDKKIIFVLQDVGINYLKHAYDTSGLNKASKKDPIYFFTFKTEWDSNLNEWSLKFDKKYSTNTEGIKKILGGAPKDDYLTVAEFVENIRKKSLNEL